MGVEGGREKRGHGAQFLLNSTREHTEIRFRLENG